MSIARLMQQAAAGVSAGGGVVWTDPDLANASYDSVSFSVAGQDDSVQDLFFKPDGYKLYIAGDVGNSIYEYNLISAWDISTATYFQSFSIVLQHGSPTGVSFKSDGLKMYVIGRSSDRITEYNLSLAWDISTATYSQQFAIGSFESQPSGVFFRSDGTKLYVIGFSGDDINEFNLSVAFDISTSSYVQNFSVSSQDTLPFGFVFNPDGSKVYVVGRTNSAIYEYNLSSAWNISTASYSGITFSLVSQGGTPAGVFFKSDGSKMYVVVSAGTIYQYSTA
tara:strand:- start:73 stop:909 length:837 start_codon:yes stop_codon:yes gene_type:complete